MPACDVQLSSIFPSCEAFKSVAGVRTFGYYCRRADITAYTHATDGTVTGVTLPTGKLKKFETGKFQNSGAFALAASTIGKKRFTQTYINRIYYRSQADRNAMTAYILADDVVVFSPNNDNQIEIYGADLGLEVTTVAGGTGTKLDDDNTALLTLTGAESDLPVLFNTVAPPASGTPDDEADFQANVAYLDALVGA